MRLTVQTDYALRVLMHLAVHDERLVTIAEIAERYGISKNHLMKVAQALTHLGAVASVRGRNGGLSLARRPQEVSIGEIVRSLEKESALVECFPNGAGECLITPSCKLKGVLAQAQEAFFAVLDEYSIHDLVKRNPALRGLSFGRGGMTQSRLRSAEERRKEIRASAAAMGIDEAYIATLVETFYARVRAHSLIGPIFENAIGDNWERHLSTMKSFWASVALNAGQYSGKPVPAHKKHKQIQPWHFNIWLALFEQTLKDTAPTPGAVTYFMERAERIAQSLQLAMFGLPMGRNAS